MVKWVLERLNGDEDATAAPAAAAAAPPAADIWKGVKGYWRQVNWRRGCEFIGNGLNHHNYSS